MGRPDKRKVLKRWIQRLCNEKVEYTRIFFNIHEFFDLYCMTSNADEVGFEFPSFMRLVNSMAKTNYCENLKRSTDKIRGNGIDEYNKRNNEYVIVRNCHVGLCIADIKRRKFPSDLKQYSNCKQDEQSSQIHKVNTTLKSAGSSNQTSTQSKSAPSSHPSDNPSTPAPSSHPSDTPVSPFLPLYTPPNILTLTMPMYNYHMPIVTSPFLHPFNTLMSLQPPIQPNSESICAKLECLPDPEECLPAPDDSISITIEHIPKENILYTDNISEAAIEYIRSAKKLKFKRRPRKNVIFPWLDDIEIRKNKKSFDEEFKRYLLMKAYELDYQDLNFKNKIKLANAILRRESYLAGYLFPFLKPKTFNKIWLKLNNEIRQNPSNAAFVLNSKKGENKTSYVAKIEKEYPQFLHEMYRFSTGTLGITENTIRICKVMNQHAKETYPDCPIRGNLHFTKNHFWKWFYKHGGKVMRSVTKPRLTPEHIKNRYKFSKKWVQKLKDSKGKLYYCFLDEKWFYTSSRRKKLKILPQAPFESLEDSFVHKPKARSRRFPCKVMFMSIICPPIDDKTDGKIMIKRVSEQVLSKKGRYNQNFVSKYQINHKLKAHEWRSLYEKDSEMSIYDLLTIIKETYSIDDDVGDDLVLVYYSKKMQKGEVKNKLEKLDPREENGPVLRGRRIRYKTKDGTLAYRPLKIKDLLLRVNPKEGSIMEKDLTCDSNFMMKHMHEIGKSIRETYSFLPHKQEIYLFMDNASGHGKTEVKKEYERILKEDYNILIKWQVPNSPETNMLDLGVWVAIQHQVDTLHRLVVLHKDQLAKNVNKAFSIISPNILKAVHERWKLVLRLILAGKGTNELVEEHRGDLNRKLLADEQLPKVPDNIGYKSEDDGSSDDSSVDSEVSEEEDDETIDKEAEAERLIDGT